MVGTQAIRIAIVDDHSVVRQGMRSFLVSMGMDVIGEGANGNEAVEIAEQHQPDVMLLDIRMKGSDGLSALPHIKEVSPATQVIMLTTYANSSYLTQAMRDGACGYLLKETELEDIVTAIHTAAANTPLIDRSLLNQALQQQQNQPPVPADIEPPEDKMDALAEPISDREYDVLKLLTQGMSNSDIADKLQISVTTVKTHVKHILRKLEVNDRTQAALMALRLGLVD